MHHFDGHDVEISDGQGLMGMDLVESDGRYTRITIFRKTIGQHLQHPLFGNGIGIDVDLTKLTIRPDIIHPSHMVVMAMGNQDPIDLPERLWQDLLTEIRATVDQQARLISLHQHRTTRALIPWILTLTHLALAPNHWYPTRCSRT